MLLSLLRWCGRLLIFPCLPVFLLVCVDLSVCLLTPAPLPGLLASVPVYLSAYLPVSLLASVTLSVCLPAFASLPSLFPVSVPI